MSWTPPSSPVEIETSIHHFLGNVTNRVVEVDFAKEDFAEETRE